MSIYLWSEELDPKTIGWDDIEAIYVWTDEVWSSWDKYELITSNGNYWTIWHNLTEWTFVISRHPASHWNPNTWNHILPSIEIADHDYWADTSQDWKLWWRTDNDWNTIAYWIAWSWTSTPITRSNAYSFWLPWYHIPDIDEWRMFFRLAMPILNDTTDLVKILNFTYNGSYTKADIERNIEMYWDRPTDIHWCNYPTSTITDTKFEGLTNFDMSWWSYSDAVIDRYYSAVNGISWPVRLFRDPSLSYWIYWWAIVDTMSWGLVSPYWCTSVSSNDFTSYGLNSYWYWSVYFHNTIAAFTDNLHIALHISFSNNFWWTANTQPLLVYSDEGYSWSNIRDGVSAVGGVGQRWLFITLNWGSGLDIIINWTTLGNIPFSMSYPPALDRYIYLTLWVNKTIVSISTNAPISSSSAVVVTTGVELSNPLGISNMVEGLLRNRFIHIVWKSWEWQTYYANWESLVSLYPVTHSEFLNYAYSGSSDMTAPVWVHSYYSSANADIYCS